MEYTFQKNDTFVVTGILTNGKRFSPIHTDNPHYAFGINLWKGSIWMIRGGQKSLVKKVNW
jgi:hypothetical protein